MWKPLAGKIAASIPSSAVLKGKKKKKFLENFDFLTENLKTSAETFSAGEPSPARLLVSLSQNEIA